MAHNERIKFKHCPLCKSEDFSKHHTGFSAKDKLHENKIDPVMNWMLCAKCGHSFTDGYHGAEDSEIIFSKKGDNLKIGHHIENNRIISSKMIERVLPYRDSGIWLDVGFGNASLLFAAKEFGFRPVGVDLRKENIEIMKHLGYEVYCDYLQNITLDAPCAVMSFMDVLEHIPFPGEVLKAAHDKIEDGGVLFVSMPNMDSPLWGFLSQANSNPYWGEIEHYHNFGRERLYALLKEYGFTPVRYGISERYRLCMEVVAIKGSAPVSEKVEA